MQKVNDFGYNDTINRASRIQKIKIHARKLRKNQTEAESILWKLLRNRSLSSFKFLRQHPIIYRDDYKGTEYFIADFYCAEKKVVIELDGDIHERTKEYDDFRDGEMRFLGINVLRIKNDSLMDIAATLNMIKSFLESIHI